MSLFSCRAGRFSCLVAALLFTLMVPVFAQSSPEIARGAAWLSAQVHADGSVLGSSSSIATPLQISAESALTLRLLGAVPLALITNISADNDDNTEYLSRQILVLRSAGRDSAAELGKLASKQNLDGGFGGDTDFTSNCLDTAFALAALNTSVSFAPQALRAAAYLRKTQPADGTFSVGEGGRGVYSTALASTALQTLPTNTDTQAAYNKANAWLLSSQQADGSWGNVVDTSLAYVALAGTNSDSGLQALVTGAILGRQSADGSWGQDPYVTALALRALTMRSSGESPPSFSGGTVVGRISAGAQGVAVAGATIKLTELAGKSTVSDSTGSFIFAGVPAGSYTLLVTSPAYLSKQLVIQVRNAVTTDVQLVLAELGSSGGTLQGNVRDLATNQALAGATINVSGANVAMVNTLIDGSYKLTGLVPGAIHIVAGKSGYANSTSDVTILANSVVTFSPGLSWSGSAASLTGRVLDSATQLPLAGVAVTVSPGVFSSVTAADGRFTVSGFGAGAFTASLTAPGYDAQSFSFVSQAGVSIDAQTVTLLKTAANPLPPATTAVVKGVVSDVATSLPLQGAVVELVGATSRSVTTGSDGSFGFANIVPGAFVIKASMPGYMPASGSAGLKAGDTLYFSPRLEAAITPGVAGQVIDNDTLVPLGGVAVTLDGDVTKSNAAGRFLFANVAGGNHTLTLSATGYTTRKLPVPSFDGSLTDLQTIKLALSSKLMFLSGKVTDAASGQGIAKATVTILGSGAQAVADNAGNFRIDGIPQGSITVRYSGVGYISETVIVALTPYDTLQQDRALHAGQSSTLSLNASSDRQHYPAYVPVAIGVQVKNDGAAAIKATVSVTIVNDQGDYLDSYTAQAPAAAGSGSNVFSFAAGTSTNVAFSWNSRANPPGQYFAIVRVNQVTEGDSSGFVELAQKRIGFAIDVTEAIAKVRLSPLPAYTNIGATEQIGYRVSVVNGSNVNVSSTLRYTLTTPALVTVDSGSFTLALSPAESSKILMLTGPQYKFLASGQYLTGLVSENGTVPTLFETVPISVAPGTRVDSGQTVSPAIVVPDGDKRIHIDIRLQGIEQK